MSPGSGVTIKKEPDLPVVALSSKKKPAKAKKEKPRTDSREARIEDLRKKLPHIVIEQGISLVTDDLSAARVLARDYNYNIVSRKTRLVY